jgi:cardiolipin synthase
LLFVRYDLRLHRKIVVIDGEVGFTGSLNLVDPAFFKQGKGVGQWIDAMVRMEGPSVEALGVTFLEDWELETGEGIEKLRKTGDAHSVPPMGDATVQVAPSGPATARDAIQKIVLMALYGARRELVLTTPYFVPDEALLTALTTAASRGVEVTLIVPAKVDSRFVHFASRAHQGDLLAAGVRIGLFKGGLLHTKSITVDQEMSLFGSANLDPRSMRLNFEITLAIYDTGFTRSLRELQQTYLGQSQILDESALRSRTFRERFTENVARLLSPLL